LRGHTRCLIIVSNMASSIYSRALQRASELMGGRDELAKFLGVPATDVQKWISGGARPPQSIFLRVVDYIIDETSPPENGDGGEAPARNDCAPAERPY